MFAGACGDDSDGGEGPAASGGAIGAGGGPTGGTPGAGGVVGATGGVVGATGGTVSTGGAVTGSGGAGTSPVCAKGKTTTQGTCYVPCTYDPGATPFFESGTDCQSMGWRCSHFSYCAPNIKCVSDATCSTYAGAGYKCLNAASGPLVGECAIQCTTDADCPPPVAATGTPYRCGPAETANGVISVCRFEGT